MNAHTRYLTVYNDSERIRLDRVPTHVQYIRDEFINHHKDQLIIKSRGTSFFSLYFRIPFILGFDSIFAPFPSSIKFKSIKVDNGKGKKIKIGEDGQKIIHKSSYYQGGYIQNLDILDELRTSVKLIDKSEQIKKMIKYYEKISPLIFPVLTVGGIFDKVWRSMGMISFSKNFTKRTSLYREIINFYAEITEINIEGLINATGGRGKVVNVLDDVAYKGRTIISPERWNQDFFSHYKHITSIISDAGMIPQIHTDGDITELIPLFQKAGFQGLQGWEGGADPNYINENFPDFVVIGFGDVSYILPYGTEEQIIEHVKELMSALKENRHFIIGPSTVIFKEIPLNNLKIFLSAAKKYGKY
ncbi:MAG: uroporphyrinogen decarboxylase family protein [Candidatus Hodarchaeota archaeon]